MQRRSQFASDMPWAAAVLLLVAAHFWTPDFGTGRGHDTYSPGTQGKKAFYLLMQSNPDGRNRTVRRNLEPFAKYLDPRSVYHGRWDARETALCILGPNRYPNAAEWDRLLDWVSKGGRLVIAARDTKPEFRIEKLKVEVRRLRGGIDADSDAIDTTLIDRGRLVWQANAQIIVKGPAERLLSVYHKLQAVRISHGRGTVVVIAGDFIFSNQSMAYADHSNAVLALSLIDAAPGANEIVFDESLNASGTPQVVGLLLKPLFKPLALQMLIVLVLFAWWRRRRFGPLLPEAQVARQNIVDHTDSVGVLMFRSGDGSAALKAYLRQLFGELKLKTHRGREDRVIEPIAHRLGKSAETVKRVLQRAVKASKASYLDRKEAAYIVRQLAVIRRAAVQDRRPARVKEKPRDERPAAAVAD